MKRLNIDKYILQNYKIKTNAQMAQELGCNKSTISNHRKKLGISATDLNKQLNKHIDYICDQYGKKTKTQLAKELNCSKSFIKKIWTEHNLVGTLKTTYYYNEDYFTQINSHEKAYWLGFIAADGNLYRKEGRQGLITISIHQNDVELLENFKNELNTTKPIIFTKDKRRKNTTMATLQISSDQMFNILLEKGIGIRKTFDLDLDYVFKQIPVKFYPSFILGYFDGDGSIDIPNNNTIASSHVRISGPIKNLKSFKQILEIFEINSQIIIDNRKYNEPFGSLELQNTTEKYLFLKYMYSNNVKCLNRKKERALELIKRIESNITNRSENIQAVKKYKSVVIKWEELLGRCDANQQPSLNVL